MGGDAFTGPKPRLYPTAGCALTAWGDGDRNGDRTGGLMEREKDMTRKSYISTVFALAGLATALAVAPATASEYSGSVTALTGGHDGNEQVSSLEQSYPGSVTALAGGHDGNSQPSGQPSDFQSLNGILGEGGVTQAVPTPSVANGDGFDWTDALIGALISSAVLLMAFLAARSVARRRASTAESRA